MASATMAMAEMWGPPAAGTMEATFSDSAQAQKSGQKTMAQTRGQPGNVKCVLAEENRMPGLTAVPKRSRGRRRSQESNSVTEKKTDSEFDMVIVPPDGFYMTDSDSCDSDWSVGWFEPHATDFTENDGEDSFAVLVRSYVLPSSETEGTSSGQNEDGDPTTPAWNNLLANMSSHTSPESQKKLDLWLQSLTS